MDQEKVGVLHPGDWCTKMGHQVMEVMFSKHSEAQAPTTASLDSYLDRPLDLAPVAITDDTVTAVARWILGRAGPVRMDSVSL